LVVKIIGVKPTNAVGVSTAQAPGMASGPGRGAHDSA
jgi:hypothetical protein